MSKVQNIFKIIAFKFNVIEGFIFLITYLTILQFENALSSFSHKISSIFTLNIFLVRTTAVLYRMNISRDDSG